MFAVYYCLQISQGAYISELLHMGTIYFCIEIFTLVLLNPDKPCLCKQCRSRSVGFWRSQQIWMYTVIKYVYFFLWCSPFFPLKQSFSLDVAFPFDAALFPWWSALMQSFILDAIFFPFWCRLFPFNAARFPWCSTSASSTYLETYTLLLFPFLSSIPLTNLHIQ